MKKLALWVRQSARMTIDILSQISSLRNKAESVSINSKNISYHTHHQHFSSQLLNKDHTVNPCILHPVRRLALCGFSGSVPTFLPTTTATESLNPHPSYCRSFKVHRTNNFTMYIVIPGLSNNRAIPSGNNRYGSCHSFIPRVGIELF